jgi:hypothetical protein
VVALRKEPVNPVAKAGGFRCVSRQGNNWECTEGNESE